MSLSSASSRIVRALTIIRSIVDSVSPRLPECSEYLIFLDLSIYFLFFPPSFNKASNKRS